MYRKLDNLKLNLNLQKEGEVQTRNSHVGREREYEHFIEQNSRLFKTFLFCKLMHKEEKSIEASMKHAGVRASVRRQAKQAKQTVEPVDFFGKSGSLGSSNCYHLVTSGLLSE